MFSGPAFREPNFEALSDPVSATWISPNNKLAMKQDCYDSDREDAELITRIKCVLLEEQYTLTEQRVFEELFTALFGLFTTARNAKIKAWVDDGKSTKDCSVSATMARQLAISLPDGLTHAQKTPVLKALYRTGKILDLSQAPETTYLSSGTLAEPLWACSCGA
jgi:hypothetical protein